MAQLQRLDPLLLAEGQGHEVAQLDQFRVGEVLVQSGPELVVGGFGVEQDGLGVGQRRLLPLVVPG